MRRFLPLCLALLLIPAAGAWAGASKEFKEGFRWTLPGGWTFAPVSPDQKQNGFVASAQCQTATITVYAFVQASDLDVAGRVEDVRQQGVSAGNVRATLVRDTTVSGVPGKVVIQKIKQDGSDGQLRTYIIKSGGKFYQLIVRAWHGSAKTTAAGLNAVRKGFRLLQGAGGQDKDEPMDELDKAGSGDGADGPSGGGDPGAKDKPEGWPATGPTLDGTTLKCDRLNVWWTLPKDGPFHWAGSTDHYDQFKFGQLAWAMGRVKRDKKEYEKDSPDFNYGRLELLVLGIHPGFKADEWIRNGSAQKQVEDWDFFSQIVTAKTRTWDDQKLGNIKCALVKFEGRPKGRSTTGDHAMLMLFCGVLKGKLYVARAWCVGYTDLWKTMAKPIGIAVKGVHFLDTKEGVRGPLLGAIPDFASARGEGADEEKEYAGAGYVFKKPVGLSHVEAHENVNQGLRWAGEGRSKDLQAYLYFEIRSFSLKVPYGQPMPREENFIEKRAQQWKAGAGADATTSRHGRGPIMRKGSFAHERGLQYEFTGKLGDVPFVEHGYVVKHKQHMFWIKMQFGGKDAEKKLKDLARDVEHGLKWSR
jgi:hypothetical protein